MPEIIPIDVWGGSRSGTPSMDLPAQAIWVHHSVTPATDDPWADFQVLNRIGLSNGHGGISYSFVIHPTGVIGEGQGNRRGAHTGGNGCNGSGWGWNPCSFGVCFVGNYNEDVLTPDAIRAFQWLRDLIAYLGGLRDDYWIAGHRDAPGNSTACPGINIENALDLLRAPYPHETTEDTMKGIFIKAPNNPKVWWWWGTYKSWVTNQEVFGAMAYCGFSSDGQVHEVQQSLIDALIEVPFGVQAVSPAPAPGVALSEADKNDIALRVANLLANRLAT